MSDDSLQIDDQNLNEDTDPKPENKPDDARGTENIDESGRFLTAMAQIIAWIILVSGSMWSSVLYEQQKATNSLTDNVLFVLACTIIIFITILLLSSIAKSLIMIRNQIIK